jgi:leucyl-tRNA synthetase
LANEQVDAEGKSWRSGAVVERIKMNQWYLRITEYNERLERRNRDVGWM